MNRRLNLTVLGIGAVVLFMPDGDGSRVPAAGNSARPNIIFILADDLGEKRNLAREQPAKAAALKTMLTKWRQELKATIPVK